MIWTLDFSLPHRVCMCVYLIFIFCQRMFACLVCFYHISKSIVPSHLVNRFIKKKTGQKYWIQNECFNNSMQKIWHLNVRTDALEDPNTIWRVFIHIPMLYLNTLPKHTITYEKVFQCWISTHISVYYRSSNACQIVWMFCSTCYVLTRTALLKYVTTWTSIALNSDVILYTVRGVA